MNINITYTDCILNSSNNSMNEYLLFHDFNTFSYHSAPESMEDDHVYERTNPQYLELSEIPQERHYSDIKEEEDELQLSRSDDWEDYEEIEWHKELNL